MSYGGGAYVAPNGQTQQGARPAMVAAAPAVVTTIATNIVTLSPELEMMRQDLLRWTQFELIMAIVVAVGSWVGQTWYFAGAMFITSLFCRSHFGTPYAVMHSNCLFNAARAANWAFLMNIGCGLLGGLGLILNIYYVYWYANLGWTNTFWFWICLIGLFCVLGALVVVGGMIMKLNAWKPVFEREYAAYSAGGAVAAAVGGVAAPMMAAAQPVAPQPAYGQPQQQPVQGYGQPAAYGQPAKGAAPTPQL